MTLAVLTLLHPWALVGLLALPVLWWLHRRLARPPRVDVPSLLFFVEESGPLLAAARRRRDVELVLALVAGSALALAAAAPVLASGASGRSVRVVVAGGAPAQQTGYRARVEAELEKIRAAATSDDDVEVVWGALEGPRPSVSALTALARAGDPGLAIVISDVLPPEPPADVRWVAVGDARARNVGIVAADLEPGPDGPRLLVTVLNHAPAPATVTVRAGDERVPLALTPDEAKAVVRTLAASRGSLEVRLEGLTDDALPADDRVDLRRDSPRWAIDARLSESHREAASAALEAVLGTPVPTGTTAALPDVEHWVLPAEAQFRPEGRDLLLHTVPEGEAGIRAPAGVDVNRDVPLSSAGLDLVYPFAPGAVAGTNLIWGAPPAQDLVWRESGDLRWLVVQAVGTSIYVLPDVTRGSPSPSSRPFWPLLVDEVVRRTSGELGAAGARRKGLLDPASTRLGRVARPFHPAWLAGVPPRERPVERPLHPWLVALGLAALAGLWLASAGRFARARARAPGGALQRVG